MKFEIRNSKLETNPKHEIQNKPAVFRASCFVLVSDFGFRISCFVLAAMMFLPWNGTSSEPSFPTPPSPQEILASFHLDPSLKVELVASEPDVQSPVAMAFDERGRLWVVEMADYPNGPAKGEKPAGRIKILEERDGVFRTKSVFAEGLLFANGIMPWRDGAIVTCAPHVLFLRDTDGDGMADQREVLFEGFSTGNPQLRVSHPVLGMDNWIYVANGLRGGKVIRPGQPASSAMDLSGRDFRFDLIRGRHEPVSGLGQYGNTFDDWGNRFVCDNRHHLRHVVLDDRYLRRNPYVAVESVVQDTSELELGEAGAGAKIWPLSKNWTTSNLHAGRFTAACSTFIYRGDLMPSSLYGIAFTCDPTGNLVHGERLRSDGASFRSRPLKDGMEFLASTSDWFRPVFLTSGPDGALYVVDMTRAVIEHPEWMPPELQHRSDLNVGRDKGRIWRIVPRDRGARRVNEGAFPTDTPGIVKALTSANAWHRTTAQRLLLERQDKNAIPLLRKLALGEAPRPQPLSPEGRGENGARPAEGRGENKADPRAQLHAAWLLEALGGLDAEVVMALLESKTSELSEHGLVLSELLPPGESQDRVRALVRRRAADPDPRVRFQAALTIGTWNDDSMVNALSMIAMRDTDAWLRKALAIAVPERAGELLTQVVDLPEQALAMARELAEVIGARHHAIEVRAALKCAGQQRNRLLAMMIVRGMADGMERRGMAWRGFIAQAYANDAEVNAIIDALVMEAENRAKDPKEPMPQLLWAVDLLGHCGRPTSAPLLADLLQEHPDPSVRQAAVRNLARSSSPTVPGLLLASWRGYSPALRGDVLRALLRSKQGTDALLHAIDKRAVVPADLDPDTTRRLTQHADPALRERAQKLLQDVMPEERKAVLTRYQAALALKGELAKGREIFRSQCATCHQIAGIGVQVGPDISDNRTKTPAALLNDILNPNAAIDAHYVTYAVRTRSGQVFTGLLASETAASVTLRRAGNETDVILRADLEEMRSTGQSLMPDGMERVISVEQMADLLAFLKNWRNE